MCSTPPGSGSNASRMWALPVSAREPMVRPWKPSTSASTRLRAPPELLSRASLNAASFASAPELPNQARPWSPAPASRVMRSASSSAGSVVK
jgi:hypothetical protein